MKLYTERRGREGEQTKGRRWWRQASEKLVCKRGD